MKMIFIFIDGFGLGEKNKDKNPIYAANSPSIRHILNDFKMMPTDACLDVPGLPQSATGQTAIFTGVNASKALNRHLHGQPTITLKKIINKNNLFKELLNRGLKVTNANVYRGEYLQNMLEGKDRRLRPSVTTVMAVSEGVRLRTVPDYIKGRGVYHDIEGKILVEGGYVEEPVSPQEAARRLYNVSRDYDFTLYEHFMSDIIGHKMDLDLAVKEIELLDAFLGELLRIANLDEDLIFITSDHGNIEDITVKTHTFNKVPTVIMGKIPHGLDIEVKSLTDITPTVVRLFEGR